MYQYAVSILIPSFLHRALQYSKRLITTFRSKTKCFNMLIKKGKGFPQQAEVAQGVPVRLRPRIFLTVGTTRVVGRQPYAPAAFTPGKITGTHF
jgi:hypothetical protein